LQKSIIFVETEDIELDDNEDEMDRIAAARDNSDATFHDQDGAANVDDANNADFNDRLNDDVSASGSAVKRKAENIGDETLDPDVNADGSGAAPSAGDQEGRKSEKKPKKKTQISFEQYRSIKEMIALFLKQQEDSAGYQGTRWGDVVAWYLQQFQEDHTDLESFERQKKLVNQVIKRMIRHEGSIIEVDLPVVPTVVDNNEKLLRLGPGYDDGPF
jgi:hypothetical protein